MEDKTSENEIQDAEDKKSNASEEVEDTSKKPQEGDTSQKTEVGGSESESSQKEDKEKQSLYAQKEHYRNKVKKLEEEIEKLKEEKGVDKEPTSEGEDNIVDLVKRIQVLKDFSPEELEIIHRNARGAGISLEEAAQLDDVKMAIEARREKVAKEKKVPEPSSRSVSYEGKSLSDLSDEELAEGWKSGKLQEQILRAKGKSRQKFE